MKDVETARKNEIIASDNEAEVFRCIAFVNVTFNQYNVFRHYKIDMPGVYIVVDKLFNVLYVGEAVNIQKRLKRPTHPVKKIPFFKFEDHTVISIIIPNSKERYLTETILIAALRPKYNTVKYLHGKVPKR